MERRKEIRQAEAVNIRLSTQLRDRLDRVVEQRRATAPIGMRVTLGELVRGLVERGLDELEDAGSR